MKKLTLSIILMLGVMMVGASMVSADFGPIGPDYALANHDGGSDTECTFEVNYDDSAYYEFDDEEELQARWDEAISTDAVVTNVEVHVLGREIDPSIEANVQLWSTTTDESLTSYQSFPYNTWTTLVFQDSDLTDEVQARVSAGEDIELELDFEGGAGSEAVEIDYMWLLVEFDSDECSDCDLEIQIPEEGSYQNDDVSIEWNSEDCESDRFWLDYALGECSPESSFQEISSNIIFGNSYEWTSEIDDEQVCIRVSAAGCCDSDTQEFFIDNLAPTADANGETCVCEGECCEPICDYDLYTCNEGDSIILDGSNSVDEGNFPSGIASWEWYVNGSYVGEGETLEYDCLDGDQTLDVELVVTDDAGNSGSDDESVINVLNVNPTCEILGDSIIDTATMMGVSFEGLASDVAADMPKMLYSWDFGDEPSATGNPVTHEFDSEGVYTVTLTVKDTDGGIGTCTQVVDVREPHELALQEVAAFYELEADFGVNSGSVPKSFNTTLLGTTDCELISSPSSNLISTPANGDSCEIFWDMAHTANPTNDERGLNNIVLVRVENSSGAYEYFTFDVNVYSWIIEMDEEWNLMSIPLTAEDSRPGIVFNGSSSSPIEQIWSYEYNSDTDTSEWMCVQPTSPAGSKCSTEITKLESIVPGKAYWVKLKDGEESAVVKGMGVSPNEVQGGFMLPPSVDVPTNAWSLIGRYGIVGKPYEFDQMDYKRVHGILPKRIALYSVDKTDNDLLVYDEDFEMTSILRNNEGYWLWIKDTAFKNSEFESYAPVGQTLPTVDGDTWYPKNSGKTTIPI